MAAEVGKSQLSGSFADEKDMTPGSVAYDADGNVYIKCKSAAVSIGANTALKVAAVAATSERGYRVPSVNLTTGPTDVVFVVNNTGGAVSIGRFFWAKWGPVITVLAGTTDAVAAGAIVYASATGGEVDDTRDASTPGALGQAITASSGAGSAIDVVRV